MKYNKIKQLGSALKGTHETHKLANKIEALVGSRVRGIVKLKNAKRNVAIIKGILSIDKEYNVYIIGNRDNSILTFKLDDITEIDIKGKKVTISVS